MLPETPYVLYMQLQHQVIRNGVAGIFYIELINEDHHDCFVYLLLKASLHFIHRYLNLLQRC